MTILPDSQVSNTTATIAEAVSIAQASLASSISGLSEASLVRLRLGRKLQQRLVSAIEQGFSTSKRGANFSHPLAFSLDDFTSYKETLKLTVEMWMGQRTRSSPLLCPSLSRPKENLALALWGELLATYKALVAPACAGQMPTQAHTHAPETCAPKEPGLLEKYDSQIEFLERQVQSTIELDQKILDLRVLLARVEHYEEVGLLLVALAKDVLAELEELDDASSSKAYQQLAERLLQVVEHPFYVAWPVPEDLGLPSCVAASAELKQC